MGTSSEFMKNYDGSKPGTYIWERKVWGDVPWEFDTQTGTLTFLEGGEFSGYADSPWNISADYKVDPKHVKFLDFKEKVYTPKDSSYLFATLHDDDIHYDDIPRLVSLLEIKNISKLDTSKTENMNGMFAGLRSIKKLDLSSFDTSNVTSMQYMFMELNSVESLNISNFDTSNVLYMNHMFRNLESIKNIDFKNAKNFNTSKVKNMYNMFTGLKSLEHMDLSNFNTTSVENMSFMFYDLPSLETLNIESFDTKNTKEVENMLVGLKNLKEITLGPKSSFKVKDQEVNLPSIMPNISYTENWMNKNTGDSVGTSSEFMKNYDGSKPGTYVWERKVWGDVPWEFDSQTGTLTFLEGGKFTEYKESPWNTEKDYKVNSSNIKKIIFKEKIILPESSDYLFSNDSKEGSLDKLISFVGLDKLDTSQVTSMSGMFSQMSSITRLELPSSFQTEKVQTMNKMFSGMSSLQTLNIKSLNTESTSKFSMQNMFENNNQLKELVLGRNFDMEKNIYNVNLPKIENKNDYTGNWLYLDRGEVIGTSDDFMKNYDGNKPGTYIWEKKVEKLELRRVPENYNFTTKLRPKNYLLEGNIPKNNKIIVYNNSVNSNWSVKATFVDKKLKLNKAPFETINVTTFKLNNNDIFELGNKGIVASSPSHKTSSNNYGEIQTEIRNVSISFVDTLKILKADNTLNGVIRYQLYNTSMAE